QAAVRPPMPPALDAETGLGQSGDRRATTTMWLSDEGDLVFDRVADLLVRIFIARPLREEGVAVARSFVPGQGVLVGRHRDVEAGSHVDGEVVEAPVIVGEPVDEWCAGGLAYPRERGQV